MLQQKTLDNVPNVSFALRILLTFPVSVASVKRSFSELKLMKIYIRSTMLQKGLAGLATVCTEHAQASERALKELGDKLCKGKDK